MPHVPEHDSELEGEGDDREEPGVDLSVARDAVGIDDLLEWHRELIRCEVGRTSGIPLKLDLAELEAGVELAPFEAS